MDYSERIKRLKEEIRDLKTAQITQSSSKASVVTGTIPLNAPQGSNTWTITYEPSDDEYEPLLEIPNTAYFRIAILPYDADTNTQTLQRFNREAETRNVEDTFYVFSSRPIRSIVRNF